MSAQQEALRMEFVLVKEKQEAERERIKAEGITKYQQIVADGIETTRDLATSSNSKVVIIWSR